MKHSYTSRNLTPFRGGGSRFSGAKVNLWLMVASIALFLIDVIGRGSEVGRLVIHFALGKGVLLELWRWLLYPFVNVSIGSWLFGLVTLYVFGRLLERNLGSVRYATLLVLTTLLGAIVYTLLSSTSLMPLTGMSGLSVAVLVSIAMTYPDQQVQLLIPPVPVKLKTLVIALVGLMVVLAIAQPDLDGPAVSLAHLSGAAAGFLFMKNRHWLDVLSRKQKAKVKTKVKKRVVKKKNKAKRKVGMKARTELKMRVSKSEAEVDKILEKVSAEGIGNLTDEEREILKFASKKND